MTLHVDGVHFAYRNRPVLRDVSCAMQQGEVVTLLGPNGAGKTTLLKCMLALLRPQRGHIRWNAADIHTMQRTQRATTQGYVPQQAPPAFRLTVFETVLLGRKPYVQFAPRTQDFLVVEQVLRYLDLHPMAERFVPELSGGERQKVFLARALAQEPAALFLDEPTAALDIAHQVEVLSLLQDLARNRDKLIVLVMHDLTLAARYSDRLLLMKDGALFADGAPPAVLTAANLRAVYGVEAEVKQGRFGTQVTVIGRAGPAREQVPE